MLRKMLIKSSPTAVMDKDGLSKLNKPKGKLRKKSVLQSVLLLTIAVIHIFNIIGTQTNFVALNLICNKQVVA